MFPLLFLTLVSRAGPDCVISLDACTFREIDTSSLYNLHLLKFLHQSAHTEDLGGLAGRVFMGA